MAHRCHHSFEVLSRLLDGHKLLADGFLEDRVVIVSGSSITVQSNLEEGDGLVAGFDVESK